MHRTTLSGKQINTESLHTYIQAADCGGHWCSGLSPTHFCVALTCDYRLSIILRNFTKSCPCNGFVKKLAIISIQGEKLMAI